MRTEDEDVKDDINDDESNLDYQEEAINQEKQIIYACT